MNEFKFSYYTATNGLVVDDNLITAKMGPFVKKEFAVSDIQYFYVFENNQYRVLYITYFKNGKIKKVQLYSEHNESGFGDMMEYMNSHFGSKSLNSLSEEEALKMMHVANPNKWAPPVVFIILSVCMSILFFPYLRHYFDSGSVNVEVEKFSSPPDFGTRNVTVNGYLLDAGVKETITSSKRSSKTTSTFIPMVGKDWQEGGPIYAILEFNELSGSEFDEMIEKTNFTGVIRNIWWEGVSSDNLNFLKKEYSLNFPVTPVLIEVTNTFKNDGFVIWVWGGTMLFILILVMVVSRKMKKKT